MTRLNSSEMPSRIWLVTDEHSGEIGWVSELGLADLDEEYQKVEYVRADLVSEDGPS